MSKRKSLPDQLNVMDALQGITTKPLQKPDIKRSETREQGGQQIRPRTRETLTKTSDAPLSTSKSKINLYVTKGAKRRIEQAQVGLRNLAPEGLDGQINYSLIVETAVHLALEEFERDGENSLLCQEIMAHLRRK